MKWKHVRIYITMINKYFIAFFMSTTTILSCLAHVICSVRQELRNGYLYAQKGGQMSS